MTHNAYLGFNNVSPCLIMSNIVSLCLTLFDNVSLCLIMSDNVSRCLIMAHVYNCHSCISQGLFDPICSATSLENTTQYRAVIYILCNGISECASEI
jgi:hypothetical protein